MRAKDNSLLSALFFSILIIIAGGGGPRGGGGPHRGGGPIRGGGPDRFGDSRRANIPYNREGHIKSYTKDDGQKAHAKGGTDTATFLNPSNRFKPRSSVPTMDQIQSGKN